LERDPSSGTDFVRATFSHKGRRKKARHVGNGAGDFTSLRLKRELRQMEMAGPPEFQLGSLQIALQ